MDDRDFMSMMYQGFTKTTNAETAYWGYEPDEDSGGNTFYSLFYVDGSEPDEKRYIGTLEYEADAAFITAVHGCFPDLHRRWLEALEEADRLDLEKDLAENVAAELSDRLAHLNKFISEGKIEEDWHGKSTGV